MIVNTNKSLKKGRLPATNTFTIGCFVLVIPGIFPHVLQITLCINYVEFRVAFSHVIDGATKMFLTAEKCSESAHGQLNP